MHIDPHEFVEAIAEPLGWFYVAACALNVGAAICAARRRKYGSGGAWLIIATVFGVLAALSLAGRPRVMPDGLKLAIDSLLSPVSFTLGAYALLTILYLGRNFCVKPVVAWAAFNVSLLFMGLSMTDPVFASIVTKPDNVPIVAMVYLLGFFTWLGVWQAVRNDQRIQAGEPPIEKDYSEKVLTWPDLVYPELICMILVTVLLVVWSLVLRAPLEGPANPVVTPNPSKAPWYFLGLQELLVFSDPWLVGVVVPCLIVFGLAAIPYLDRNPEGSGYYTINKRKFAFCTFQFGFLALWVLLILIGTFFRGPNWNFFGLYEVRDPYKVVALNNVKLSEYFWVILLGRGLPQAPSDAGPIATLGYVLWREMAGVVLLAVYFIALPPLLGRTILKKFRRDMGFWRYTLMAVLLLLMLTIPLKMLFRWTMNLNYIVSIPEYLLNF